MKQYQALLEYILENGNDRGDRTGTGTRSVFGAFISFDLTKGFPLLTTKKMAFKPIVTELLWFLRGDTNIKYLLENGCHIWTADAYRIYKRKVKVSGMAGEMPSMADFEYGILNNSDFCKAHGDLGPIYGKQWRQWIGGEPSFTTDQIKNVINSIKINPESRRHIVTAWNPAEADNMALPPCHCLFQFYVHDNSLSCHMYQRSADVFLGVPFNIASYALLTHIIAQQTGLGVGRLNISFGDVHIYQNHIDQVKEQLTRKSRALPKLAIDIGAGIPEIDKYTIEDFILTGYDPYPPIKGELSVGV